jgi:hypothetical protein
MYFQLKNTHNFADDRIKEDLKVRGNKMTKNELVQLNLFTDPAGDDQAKINTEAGGRKLYDPRDGQYKVSNNPALILRNLYVRTHDGELRTLEIIDTYICEQADIADQFLFIPDGKGSFTAF